MHIYVHTWQIYILSIHFGAKTIWKYMKTIPTRMRIELLTKISENTIKILINALRRCLDI